MASAKGGQQPNREELLQMGMRAAKAGNKDAARMMFQRVLTEDKRNERALMWMAQIADSKEERNKWLNRVLLVNPDNEKARRYLEREKYKVSAKQNRTLLVFGMIAGVLIVLGLVVLAAVLLLR
jgi:hypothetical protein